MPVHAEGEEDEEEVLLRGVIKCGGRGGVRKEEKTILLFIVFTVLKEVLPQLRI